MSWRETARWASSSGGAEFFWLTLTFGGILLNLYHTCVDHSRSQIVVPALPGKALKRQLPFRPDEGLFEESFIEERRLGLEQFINRSVDVVGLEYAGFVPVYLVFAPNKAAVKHVCLPSVCTSPQNCRSPSGPEWALSSHVPAGGNHRPRLHSWKSTTLGLLGGWGLNSGVQVGLLPSPNLPPSSFNLCFPVLLLCLSLSFLCQQEVSLSHSLFVYLSSWNISYPVTNFNVGQKQPMPLFLKADLTSSNHLSDGPQTSWNRETCWWDVLGL